MPIINMMPAGTKKTHCQGSIVTTIPPTKKMRARPL
jgi:hypothetical protein